MRCMEYKAIRSYFNLCDAIANNHLLMIVVKIGLGVGTWTVYSLFLKIECFLKLKY